VNGGILPAALAVLHFRARGANCASPNTGSAWLPSSRLSSPRHWNAA